MSEPVIDISRLRVGFRGKSGVMLPVLRDVSLQVGRGESVGIVGESGSGKSTLALAAMGYLRGGLQKLAGEVRFQGRDVFAMRRAELEAIRGGKLGLIPQNSGQALTPTLRVGAQMCEALALHRGLEGAGAVSKARDLLEQVRLPDARAIMGRFPHELSGGQQQRVAIAMALAGAPDALILDEPTTGLDVTTQAHILVLLQELARERDMAMVFVSHDLGVIAHSCAKVAVMYAGRIVLEGPAEAVLEHPAHPYPKALLAAIPRLGETRLPAALEGRPPAPGEAIEGCAFAPRCALAGAECGSPPSAVSLPDGQVAACVNWAQVAEAEVVPRLGEIVHAGQSAEPVLGLNDVALSYARPGVWARITGQPLPVMTVEGVTLQVARGETLGLVGESGSGKSTILKAIAGLLPPASGQITLAGQPLPPGIDQRRPDVLRRVQMIFQNPDQALNPRQSVADILAQPLRLYDGASGAELRSRSEALLEMVRLGPSYMERMPGQLSGGEKQRLAVARAFAASPEVVLCDEVTSALDVSVQAAVLDLLNDLKREKATTYVFVSHDLAVVRALSDSVAVLYQGRLCEHGPAEAVFSGPSHPYTEALLGAVLEPEPGHAPKLRAEDVPELSPPARGCPFQRRCPRKLGQVCEVEAPPAQGEGGHLIRCHIPLSEL